MEHPKMIAIVAGGRLLRQFTAAIIKSDHIIGVDRGAYWLIVNGVIPDIAIGDFDSVTMQELEKIKTKIKKIIQYSAEKDWTDLELAVNFAAKLQPLRIDIFGALGTRLDHSLAAVQLLEKLAKKKINASIIDEHNRISIVNAKHTIQKSQQYRYVSFLPSTASISLSLDGFKYNVTRKKISKGTTIGISNEIVKKEGIVTIHDGTALLVQSRD